MGLRQILIDAWSSLNYKPVFSDRNGMPNRRAFPEAQSMWVPAQDARRLAAYKLLAAYDQNQAAELAELQDGPSARERREYGDPAMFVETIMDNVLGREQSIVVPGADHDGDGEPDPETVMAERVQDLLRDWATDELLPMRIKQCERKAVSLGDGVYRLAWDPAKRRVTLRVTDPGFYFPVLPEDGDDGDYPSRVHFAWELPEDTRRGLKARLRRITYELDWIRPATASGLDSRGRSVRAPSMTAGEDGQPGTPVLTRGDTVNPGSGAIERQYAWNDQPTPFTCYLTDATWLMEDLSGQIDVDSLPMDKAVFAAGGDGEVLDHLDLLIDFIPVVHVPNTVPPAEEHWGQSSLAKVLQVFDELSGIDTDSARASATTGAPMIGVWGKARSSQTQQTVTPGLLLELGEGGGMVTLDTSKNLAELRNHQHDIAERAAKNARLPAVSLGTLDPSKVPSGYALELSLGPLDSLVGGMRLARDHKYALLLKFVQRLFLAGQHPDWAGVTVQAAELSWGPYTPTDKASVLEHVTTGVQAGVLSLETAVRMLQEAGFPINDVTEEIKNIESRQFEQARALADATGDPGAVGKFLGIQVTPDTAPTPVLPGLTDTPTDTAPAPAQAQRGEGS